MSPPRDRQVRRGGEGEGVGEGVVLKGREGRKWVRGEEVLKVE